MNFEFTPEQVIYLSVVASISAMVLRLAYELLAKKKLTLPEWVMNFGVFLVSLVISLIWQPVVIPPLPLPFTGDPAVDVPATVLFVQNFVGVFAVVLAFAVFIYKYLIVKVKEYLAKKLMPSLYPTAEG